MVEQALKLKEEFTFKNLYDYFYQVYLNGEYREIKISYTDFNDSKYITIESDSLFDMSKVSLYEVMAEGTPQEERNCFRYFDKEGEYSEDIDLKGILEFFNKNYKNKLRTYHVVEL